MEGHLALASVYLQLKPLPIAMTLWYWQWHSIALIDLNGFKPQPEAISGLGWAITIAIQNFEKVT